MIVQFQDEIEYADTDVLAQYKQNYGSFYTGLTQVSILVLYFNGRLFKGINVLTKRKFFIHCLRIFALYLKILYVRLNISPQLDKYYRRYCVYYLQEILLVMCTQRKLRLMHENLYVAKFGNSLESLDSV